VTSANNKKHGLEIGNGSNGVQVNGGNYWVNGTAGDPSTGGGIMIYADAGQTVTGTSIIGTVNALTNTTAGIYLFCNPGGHINQTTIGDASGTVSLDDNGSTGVSYGTGGAAVLVFGPCDQTTIWANSTNTGAVNPTAGLVVLGTDASGSNSPTNTVAKNCTLTGYTSTSPAATMYATHGGTTVICTNDVDAKTNNMINGAATGYDVEDVLVHKVDNTQLGRFLAPGSTVFVTPNSGSVQRGIIAAQPPFSVATPPYTTIQVKAGTYNENVTVNWVGMTLSGDGTATVITPTSGDAITVSANNVTIQDLRVYHAPHHGIWATGVSGLTITNVIANANGFGGKASGIALRAVTGTSVLTNITSTSNTSHGLEIGRGSVGVQVVGGSFNSNGTTDDLSTGGGIMLYSDLTSTAHENEVQNVEIKGTLAANSNKTAGIYIYSTPGLVTGTLIGQSGSITLSDNGSHNGTYGNGGAGVLIFGGAASTTVSALFIRNTVVGGGLVVLADNNTGANSPTGTIVSNSTFTGYNNTDPSPAITLASGTMPGAAYICTTNVTATTNVTFTGASTASAINALIYDKLDNATLGLVSYTLPVTALLVKIKVFLQGPYSGGVMTTGLNTGGYIPLTQPYSGAPWNYSGVESVGSIPNLDVVDWILVELRTGTASTTKVETRAAFLLKDGTVVDVDGSSDVAFSVATAGDYYIVIRHRNHLAIMSAAVVTLPNATVYDFTTALTQAYENTAAPMITLGSGVFGMYAGDASANGQVKFSGSGSDRAVIQGVVGASTLTNLVNGYYSADLNMNGQVKWSGSGSDRAVLQGVVGASTLTNLVNTQVP
jgi:hypothetical protein